MEKNFTSKETAIYEAVMELFAEGTELSAMTVSRITGKAGIGKGTAYEYFQDKEEMIAKAIYYCIEKICRRLYTEIQPEWELEKKIEYILLAMEKKRDFEEDLAADVSGRCLAFRFFQVMTDDSAVGRKLRELMQNKPREDLLADELVRRVIQKALEDREDVTQARRDYLCMVLFSKIMSYGVLLNYSIYRDKENREILRDMFVKGICREVLAD